MRYKQTVLGAAWAVLQPGMMMVVFTIFFSRMAGMPSGSLPYPVFVFAGLLPWTFFANAVSTAGQSVVGNQNLITKVYFPRLIIPMGAVGAGLVDFFIAFVMLLVLMLCYGVVPGLGFLLVPLLTVAIVMAALGLGTLMCALTVAYRDFRYVVPFMMQLWMFATPSIYMDPERPCRLPLAAPAALEPDVRADPQLPCGRPRRPSRRLRSRCVHGGGRVSAAGRLLLLPSR